MAEVTASDIYRISVRRQCKLLARVWCAAGLAGRRPPARSSDFEASAIARLLDVVPPEYRLYGALRRHPAALASMARHRAAGCVEGAIAVSRVSGSR